MSNVLSDFFTLPMRATSAGFEVMAKTAQEAQKWLEQGMDTWCPASGGGNTKPGTGSGSGSGGGTSTWPPKVDPPPVVTGPPIVNIPPVDAKMTYEEVVISVYHIGRGKFSSDNPPTMINLQMDMYDYFGKWLGYQYGVHLSFATPEELFAVPPPPKGSFMDPYNPVPTLRQNEWTKGVWTWEDGSQIFAVGPAFSHLVPFNDGSFLFMVTTGQTITSGTGRFAGCAGVKQATGTAFVPAGLLQSGKFPAPGLEFEAKTLETFRLLLPKDYYSLAPAGPPEPAQTLFPVQPAADAPEAEQTLLSEVRSQLADFSREKTRIYKPTKRSRAKASEETTP